MVETPSQPAALESLLRGLLPLFLAVGVALWTASRSARARLDPPGFAVGQTAALRRAVAWSAVALSLYFGVFLALGALGRPPEWVEPSSAAALFALHGIFLVALALWLGAGFGGIPGARLDGELIARQLGLRAQSPARELLLGAVTGVAIWGAVLAAVLAFAVALSGVGLREALPAGVPPMVSWIVGLPWWLRLAVSVSAGVVEEIFFRGFLQPRLGLLGATVLFALAHLGYGEPFMLFGVTLLSLAYGLLARWRGNVLAPIAAHTVFDAVQLLVLIPTAAGASGALGA